MKKVAVNPYLPYWETVPDAEPHIFGDRLYAFGSHDQLGGSDFCVQDYVAWSAPLDDLSDWRYEGIIYSKFQDPFNGAPYAKGALPDVEVSGPTPHIMNAPDVAQGPDGRFYLFYQLGGVDVLAVAVCDTPAGKYEFLDFITREDGSVPNAGLWFDPAILVEKSGNYLYYGFAPGIRAEELKQKAPGAFVLKLADDMHTIIEDPKFIVPGINFADGTPYETHPFFEASSMRHIGDLYYFVYASSEVHELCYATSDTPVGPFTFGGVIISNGDLGYRGNTLRTNYTGNIHGGITVVNDQAYIFWHRQTHGTSFSRQGCADKITIHDDGHIDQTEMTSCGLNNGPLPAVGTYPSYIACNLTKKDRASMWHVTYSDPGEPNPPLPEDMTYITEETDASYDHQIKPFIHNLQAGSAAGFKYLSFTGKETQISLELRGTGTLSVKIDDMEHGDIAAKIDASNGSQTEWYSITTALQKTVGTHAVYVVTEEGSFDFASFEISEVTNI